MSSSRQRNSHGTLTELFKFERAAVILVDNDEERTPRFIRIGEFVINLIMRSAINSAILMCVCMANQLQWPITKDAPIIRIGKRTFVFALPGLLYGLQLSPCCKEHVIDTLERVFIKFGQYKDLNEKGKGYPVRDNDPEIWKKLQPVIIAMANKTLSEFGHILGSSPCAVGEQALGVLRLIRISAAAKMISNAILSGSLNAMHIYIQTPSPAASPKSLKNKSSDDNEPAYASISAFTDLVEAVEISWVIASGCGDLLKEENRGILVESPGFKAWRLNQRGIISFMEDLRMAAKLEKMNVNGNYMETDLIQM